MEEEEEKGGERVGQICRKKKKNCDATRNGQTSYFVFF